MHRHDMPHSELIRTFGIRVEIVGDVDILPVEVQRAAENMMSLTRHHSRAILTICFPYSSRREMAQALTRAATSKGPGDDAGVRALEQALWVPQVDVLVRTSGEVRLSDFLLWQVRFGFVGG